MSELKKESARLCHIVKSPKFDGYGFNLHAEKSKPGQYIGKVDEGSPAEAAGLRQGDRILEVNGVDISNENHKQVVERIKQNADETKLLVLSPESNSETTKAPIEQSQKTTETEEVVKNGNSVEVASPTPIINNNSPTPTEVNNHNNVETGGSIALKLKMTAAELRAQLASKKKYDPKKESIDFKKKFDIVQKL